MTDKIRAVLLDHAWIGIDTEPHIKKMIQEEYSFLVQGYKFMPLYKSGQWDGKVRLFNMVKSQLPAGLFPRLVGFANRNKHILEVENPNDLANSIIDYDKSITEQAVLDFCVRLQLPFEPRDYQLDAIVKSLRNHRLILKSPTATGKSLIIYVLAMWHAAGGGKVLLVVPDTGLIKQMSQDFVDYGMQGFDQLVHQIYQGQDKHSNKPITISTWQSIYNMKQPFFEKFTMVLGDEAHGFQAKSLSGIMNKSVYAPYRVGLTGTLDGTKVHQLALEALFGPMYTVTTTKEQQDKGNLAPLEINRIVLKHPVQSAMDYKKEIAFLVKSEARNRFIINLATKLDGNTLVLYKLVDKHGIPLYNAIQAKDSSIPCYLVNGQIKGSDREQIRQIINKHKKSITVASMGTFSTGINVPNIHNIIFASPYKRQIKVLQSIGRGLRKSDNGAVTQLYDIVDLIPYTESSKKNTTFTHGQERLKAYKQEKFEHKTFEIDLE